MLNLPLLIASPQEFMLSVPELSYSQGNSTFPSFDTSGSFNFDFGGIPSVNATGDPTAFSTEELDQIIAGLTPSSLPFDFTAPETDYSAFLMDYDGSRNSLYHNFAAPVNPYPEATPDPDPRSEPPLSSIPSANPTENNPLTRIVSEATNVSSIVSPITHVSPTALLSRTSSYNVPIKNESPMSPVSALSSPGIMSAPEASSNQEPVSIPLPTVKNPATRRVGGDWRRAFQERIPSG
jgi:hypothetical protein